MSFDFIAKKFAMPVRDDDLEVKYCDACEDGGWECYGIGFGDPHFRECPECGNPKGYPSP